MDAASVSRTALRANPLAHHNSEADGTNPMVVHQQSPVWTAKWFTKAAAPGVLTATGRMAQGTRPGGWAAVCPGWTDTAR